MDVWPLVNLSIQAMATISSPLSLHHLLPKSIKTLLKTLNPNPNQVQIQSTTPNTTPRSNLKLISRRDASAAALSALLVSHVLQQPIALAAGLTVGECELTVTPSGLGFCDRVVGTGAAASKGQLIKVFTLFCIHALNKLNSMFLDLQ